MWIVEVNVFGRRFIRRIHDRPEDYGIPARLTPWRPRKLRAPRTAA